MTEPRGHGRARLWAAALVALVCAAMLGSAQAGAPRHRPKARGASSAAPPAQAKTTAAPPTRAPSAAPLARRCEAPLSAIDAVTEAVASSLRQHQPAARFERPLLVVATSLRSDAVAPRGRELSLALAEQLAGRIGSLATAHRELLDRPAARRIAGRSGWLVLVEPEIGAGTLRLAADVYPLARTVWARARAPEPGPVAHAFASAPLDAELRSYLAPLSFETPTVRKYTGVEPSLLALGCGDLDADGAPDLWTVSRQQVTRIELRAGAARALGAVRFADLGPVAPVPLREPLAFATIVAEPLGRGPLDDARSEAGAVAGSAAARSADLVVPAYLDVGLSDRASSVRLDATLAPLATLEGLAVPAGQRTGCATLRGLLLADELEPCQPSDPPPEPARLGAPTDALASTVVFDRRGAAQILWASRRGGEIVLRSPRRAERSLGSGGAQLALGDVDQDGTPELGSSLDVLTAAKDAVVVRSVPLEGPPIERFRLAVPAGVSALAFCPADGPGRAALVVATGGELWVVR